VSAPFPSDPAPPRVRGWELARTGALVVVLVASLGGFLAWVHRFYPIPKWLFWHYAGAWLAALTWAAGCISTGHFLVRRVLGQTLPLLEHVSTSFTTGALAFFVAMNVLGHLQLYRGATFFALPLAFLALGARDCARTIARAARHLRHARAKAPPRARPFYFWPAVVFGLLGAGMVYFLILTPDNVQFDSRWKHLALAEEFAAHGGLRRFGEGFTVATYPHLTSYFYGWAFLCPGVRLFDRVEIAVHLEYVTFLATLVALPGLVRLLVPRAPGRPAPRAHLAWVARFLFPGFFLYDSSLSAGADHIGAFFVIPVVTQLLRGLRTLSPRHLGLMSASLVGVGLTKYTCTTMVLPVIGLPVALRMAWAMGLWATKKGDPELRRNAILGPLAALLGIVVLTIPHWLKNWVWYGDPAYPTLYKTLALRPWTEDAATLFEWGYKDYQFWRPTHDLKGALDTLVATLNFSFVPNDYPRFHGKVPTFGSLYTLLLACLPLLARTRRIWLVVGCTQLSLFIWFWTHHQDRYLQAILPWMAAVVAAVVTKLWHELDATTRLASGFRHAARGSIALLVVAQAVWGGDAYFIPTHAMAQSPQKRVLDLFAAGYKRDYEGRFKIYAPYTDVAKHLPKGARVMLHDNHVHLGIGAESSSDWGGWQFGISYGRLATPGAVFDRYRELGVTHVHWDDEVSKGWDSVAGDLVFFEFATRHTEGLKTIGRTRLATIPSARPEPKDRNDKVALLGCDEGNYATGLYELAQLRVPVFGPDRRKFPAPAQPLEAGAALLDAAGFAVTDPTCPTAKSLASELRARFDRVAKRKRILAPKGKRELELWVKKRGATSTAAPLPSPAPSDDAATPDAADEPDSPGDLRDDEAR
jgi:hypothetical protein